MPTKTKKTPNGVREKPILFSGPMVITILNQTKTQIRRVVNLKYVLSPEQKRIGFEQCEDPSLFRHDYSVKGFPRLHIPIRHPDDVQMPLKDCSAGTLYAPWEVGMKLWVRETWAVSSAYDSYKPSVLTPHVGTVQYFASTGTQTCFDVDGGLGKTRQSIFMPRWASRITLEVTDVRVDKVQSIGIYDIASEGLQIDGLITGFEIESDDADAGCEYCNPEDYIEAARNEFAKLWDSINQSRGFGWDTNPWVWVVSFKLLELAKREA